MHGGKFFFLFTGLLILKVINSWGNMCIKMLQQLHTSTQLQAAFRLTMNFLRFPLGVFAMEGGVNEVLYTGYTLTSTQVVVKRLLAAGKEGEK